MLPRTMFGGHIYYFAILDGLCRKQIVVSWFSEGQKLLSLMPDLSSPRTILKSNTLFF
jgi:hypothetical protein